MCQLMTANLDSVSHHRKTIRSDLLVPSYDEREEMRLEARFLKPFLRL